MDVPNHMTERFSWESPYGIMDSRKHEFRVKGDRTWYMFLKHVRNREIDKEWIDAVGETGFRAFRPEKVVQIRGIKPKSKI